MGTDGERKQMGMKGRRWYYFLPLAGILFGLWYVHEAFYDVVYSDYIRLVNSYLPDVWNPSKFLVPDVLTRVPVTYLGRIVNTAFFHYSVAFDQALGVLFLGLSAAVFASYCRAYEIRAPWLFLFMIVIFSLNKWEMMINGSGWVHFLAFAGFYYHYLVLDRVWSGQEKPGDRKKLLWLPGLLILTAAGPYCAVYVAVLILAYGLKIILEFRKNRKKAREYAGYLLAVTVPFLLYLLSNSFAVEDHAGMQDIPLLTQLLDTPGYFVRFVVKSFSSMVVEVEYAQAVFADNLPYMVLGGLVIAAYLLALWYQWKYRLYEKTILPLIFIGAGGMNHALVTLARWSFLMEDYGMSSRYALQFQMGILGILLTFALAWRRRPKKAGKAAMAVLAIVFLAGNLLSTRHELGKVDARRQVCEARAQLALDFENRTDDELRAGFEYRTSRPESGQAVRSALTILKEQGWNVFYENAGAEAVAADGAAANGAAADGAAANGAAVQ